MPEEGETRLVSCPECGLRTRYVWEEWERWPRLTKLLGRDCPIMMGAWVCATCGHRTGVRRIDAEHGADQE